MINRKGRLMTYIELLNNSVESYSKGGLSLVEVPDDLRVSQASVVALSYDMQKSIARNNSARSASERNAARMFTR